MIRFAATLRRAAMPLLVALSTAASAYSPIIASSTFDDGAEGWTTLNDARNFAWISTGGNPGGHVGAEDIGNGQTWYFVAPSSFLGDVSAAFGGSLSFELQQSSVTSPFNDSDVVLTGGGLTLVYDFNYAPGTNWTGFNLSLDAAAGWRLNSTSGAAATAADIQTVLGDLAALRIRGEYRSGADRGQLDNVFLIAAPVPEPTPVAMLAAGLALLYLTTRRRA